MCFVSQWPFLCSFLPYFLTDWLWSTILHISPIQIGDWDTSSATDLTGMFSFAAQFDQDISHWNVERVGSFTAMFLEARSFSKDVSSWNPASATSMQYMFAFPSTVTTFDHTLCWAETSSSSSYSYSYSAITALMFFGGGRFHEYGV